MFLVRVGMASRSARSKGTNRSDPAFLASASFMAAVKALFSRRATTIARYPAQVSRCAIPSPSPRLPPVTMTLRIAAHQLASVGDGQRRNDVNCYRDLVGWKSLATEVKNILLEPANR